jgi:hypothetical protein
LVSFCIGKGHHGQTGHLAEDIAEMTGNADIIKHKVDDVVLPVEHGNTDVPAGKKFDDGFKQSMYNLYIDYFPFFRWIFEKIECSKKRGSNN